MSLANMPEAILAKHPELVPIFEALSAHSPVSEVRTPIGRY
jgi:hypothetical protein